ncbi:MAG: hypothetical protein ACRDI0_10415 [Actinomycetota bacterium]
MARARTPVRALALLAAVVALAPAGAAAAQEPRIEFTVRPAHPRAQDPRTVAWLVHRAAPRSVIRDAVIVENLGSVPLDLVLYPADAISTAEGEFGLEPIEAADDGVAGWVSLRVSEVSLQPGERQEVPVTIRVPQGATPGDHPGAVVARTATPVRRGQVPTLLAVGARLYLTVPGPRIERLVLHGIEPVVEEGRAAFRLDLENRGNVILDVTGSYRIEGTFGLETASAQIARPITVLPGARVHPVVAHPDPLLGGRYRAEISLSYGDGKELQGTVSFWAGFPWPLVAVLVLAVAVTVAVAVKVRRSRRRKGDTRGNGQASPEAAARLVRARQRAGTP